MASSQTPDTGGEADTHVPARFPSRQRIQEILDGLAKPAHARRIRLALDAGLGRRCDRDVALELGLLTITIAKYREILGLPFPPDALGRYLRSRPGPGRTDDQLAIEVRRLAQQGHSVNAIRFRLRTSHERVRKIARSNRIAFLYPRSTIDWTLVPWERSDEVIANELGVPPDTVRRMRRTIHHARRPGKARIAKVRAKWRAYWNQGYGGVARRMRKMRASGRTLREIQKRLGLSEGMAQEIARRFGIRFASSYQRLRTARRRRMARRIRPLARRGLPANAIGRRLGVKGDTVTKICRRFGVRLPQRPRYRWSDVDWRQSDKEISRRLGCHKGAVAQKRRKLGLQGLRPPLGWIAWARADWRLSNAELAPLLGTSAAVVSLKRIKLRKLGLLPPARRIDWKRANWRMSNRAIAADLRCAEKTVETKRGSLGLRHLGPQPLRYDWSRADWRRSNKDIALQLGLDAEIVERKRLKLRRRGLLRPVRRADWASADWSLSDREIASQLGIPLSTVRHKRATLRYQRVGPRLRNIDWSKVDWRMSNGEIALQLGYALGTVTQMRSAVRKQGLLPPVHRVDWSKADWGQSNEEIAERVGSTWRSVKVKRSHMRAMGLLPPTRRTRRRTRRPPRRKSDRA